MPCASGSPTAEVSNRGNISRASPSPPTRASPSSAVMRPSSANSAAMVKAASAGIADADLALLVLDAKKGLDANSGLALRQLVRERRRAFLVVNKLDTIPPEREPWFPRGAFVTRYLRR